VKHHKAKDVWSHRPDALPLPDAPSTGTRRKKGALEKASKKHIWDMIHQEQKVLRRDFKTLERVGLPTRYNVGENAVSGDYYFALWAAEWMIASCTKMEKLVLELERRMV
jgi:hypothetical protein